MSRLKSHEARKEFLMALPQLSLQKIILKIIFAIILVFSFIALYIGITEMVGFKTGSLREPYTNRIMEDYVFLVAGVVLTYLVFYKRSIRNLLGSLFPKKANRSLKLFIFVLIIDLLIVLFFAIFDIKNWDQRILNENKVKIISEMGSKRGQLLINSLLISLILFANAAAEEFIFRFTLYRFLRKYGFLLAVFISSLFFFSIHYFTLRSIIQHLLFGALMCFYYEYSNSILRTTIIHTFHNLILIKIVYLIIAPLLLGKGALVCLE